MFSATLRQGRSRSSWKTNPMRRGRSMRPASGARMPAASFSSVVLPTPESPEITAISREFTARLARAMTGASRAVGERHVLEARSRGPPSSTTKIDFSSRMSSSRQTTASSRAGESAGRPGGEPPDPGQQVVEHEDDEDEHERPREEAPDLQRLVGGLDLEPDAVVRAEVLGGHRGLHREHEADLERGAEEGPQVREDELGEPGARAGGEDRQHLAELARERAHALRDGDRDGREGDEGDHEDRGEVADAQHDDDGDDPQQRRHALEEEHEPASGARPRSRREPTSMPAATPAA